MWGMIWTVFALGAVVLVMGLALAFNGSSTLGYALAGVGGIATQVGVIAMGVRLGTDG